MDKKFISVPPGMLESLFPFHFAIDKNGVTVSAGASISQKCADLSGQGLIGTSIDAVFKCVNPKIQLTFEQTKRHQQSLFLLEHKLHPCQLRGQFVYMPDDDLMLFLGSPWLTSTAQLEELCFTFDAFALHDATLDMLHSHQASLNAISDAHLLQEKLRKKNLALQGMSSDLTKVMSVLDQFQDAVFIFNMHDYHISYANIAACRLVHNSKEHLIGTSFKLFVDRFLDGQYSEQFDQFLADYFANFYRNNRDQVQSSDKAWESRVQVNKGDGIEGGIYDVTLQVVYSKNSSTSVIATLRDVTAQVMAGRANRQGERLESLGRLAGGIAHDLNNALAPISLSIGSLKRLYPNNVDILQLIESSAKRSADMVRQLLTFAKGSEGERVPICINAVMDEIGTLVKGTFPKNIRTSIDCPLGLPIFIGDPTQVHQVLLNLSVNARDAMPTGGMISIKVFNTHIDDAFAAQLNSLEPVKSGRYLAIQVKDTGTGIPPDLIDRIFDPFFTTKPSDKGTGLGLSTVMGIVKSHAGFIHVDSTLGQGTTFTVYFPITQEAQAQADPVVSVTHQFMGNGETVLVVDDEPTVREATCMLLRQFNLMSIAAEDGADAMAQLSQHRDQLRLMITDVHMPNMDGLQLAMSARRVLPKLPIIVCSGRMEDYVAQKLSQMTGVYRLNKPFHEPELLEVIRQALAPVQIEAF